MKRIIIAIILLVSMIIRLTFIIEHLNHECSHDENCPICELINNLKKDITGFDPNIILVIIEVLLLYYSVIIYLNNRLTNKKDNTLIGLKVELIS